MSLGYAEFVLHVPRLVRRIVACIVALAPASRANVLVVDAQGSGAYTDLPAAIAAANDGDVVLVRSGAYSGFTLVDRALDVVADAGAAVRIDGFVRVQSLAATRTFTVTGVEVAAPPHVAAVVLLGNSGAVRIQGCVLRGGDGIACTNGASGGDALRVTACLDVAIARSTLLGGDGAEDVVVAGQPGRGLQAAQSRIALHDCDLRGGTAPDFDASCPGAPGYGYGAAGGEGVLLDNAVAFLAAGTELIGGDGTDFLPPASAVTPGCGGSALRALGTASSALRALDALFFAGVSGTGGPVCPPAPPIATPGASMTTFSGVARRLNASRVTREGGVVRVEITGRPGDQVELSFAERGRHAPSDVLRGVQLLARRTPFPTLLAGTIGSSGTLTIAWTVGELGTGVEARRLFAQATCVEPNGTATLTGSVTLVLVDAAF